MNKPGSVVIVTGASGGIGRATALELASRGYSLGLIARRREALEAVAETIRSMGGTAVAEPADVGDREALHHAVERIASQLGPVEVMVANAGYAVRTRLNPLNTAEVEAMIRINLLGVVYSIESVLPAMLGRGSGQIVAISSLAAYKGLPGESGYCASKAAVNAYAEGLRIALHGRGIAVATICPGFVDTPMNTMEAVVTPFLITAENSARRIARVIQRGQSGVVRFPRRMALLMDLIARLPDALVLRLMSRPAPKTQPGLTVPEE